MTPADERADVLRKLDLARRDLALANARFSPTDRASQVLWSDCNERVAVLERLARQIGADVSNHNASADSHVTAA